MANKVRVGTHTNRGFRFGGVDGLSKLFDYWDDKLEIKYTEWDVIRIDRLIGLTHAKTHIKLM